MKLPPHVHVVRARGKDYYYYHPHRGRDYEGQRVKLPGDPFQRNGTPNAEWWDAYDVLAGNRKRGPKEGSFSALILEFKTSPEWSMFSEHTRQDWSRYLDRVEEVWGPLSVLALEPKHVLKLRDKYAKTPAAANNLLRCLSAMMSFAVPRGWRPNNPCVQVKKLKGGEGYAPWEFSDIDYFKMRARVDLWHAAILALYSGQRLGDVLNMRWDDIANGLIAVLQNKTRKKLWIPMHANLRAALHDIPRCGMTILTNTKGQPWTLMGFKASWSTELNRPEMKLLRDKALVFHGLRKSAVVFLLEAGCTDAEVAAITGQSRQMVEHYAKQVNQRKLAATAMSKWEASDADGASKDSED